MKHKTFITFSDRAVPKKGKKEKTLLDDCPAFLVLWLSIVVWCAFTRATGQPGTPPPQRAISPLRAVLLL